MKIRSELVNKNRRAITEKENTTVESVFEKHCPDIISSTMLGLYGLATIDSIYKVFIKSLNEDN